MKKLIFILAAILYSANIEVSAQTLFFCNNYSDEGEPIGVANTWTIGPSGSYIYLLYSNGDKKMKTKMVLLTVAKQENNAYVDVDTKVADVQKNGKWAIYDYQFTSPGNYRVTVMDNNKKELAKGFVTLLGNDQNNNSNLTNNNNNNNQDDQGNDNNHHRNDGDDNSSPDRGYYSHSKMTFCTSVEDGKPSGEDQEFIINRDGGYIYIYLMNSDPLKVSSMTLKVTRGGETVTDEKYDIDGTLPGTYLKYTFYKEGKYKVELLTPKGVVMGSGNVKITMSND